jgi:ubiquinone biosynthesis protein
VHRAVLRNGKTVAVKVQRPEIRQVIFNDLEALTDIVSTIDEYTDIGRKFAFEDVFLKNSRKHLSENLIICRKLRTLSD